MIAYKPGTRLIEIGAGWRSRTGKSIMSGQVTINGFTQKFTLMQNTKKVRTGQPDYVLISSDIPKHVEAPR